MLSTVWMGTEKLYWNEVRNDGDKDGTSQCIEGVQV